MLWVRFRAVGQTVVAVVFGGVVSVVWQWWLTPRIQRRLRAESRREDAVFELWQLVALEVPAVVDELGSAWRKLGTIEAYIAERHANGVPGTVASHRNDALDAWERLERSWGELVERVAVLSKRLGIDRRPGAVMWSVAARWVYGMRPSSATELGEDVEAAALQERELRARLLEEVEGLVAEIDERRTAPLVDWPWRRLGRWRRRRVQAAGR